MKTIRTRRSFLPHRRSRLATLALAAALASTTIGSAAYADKPTGWGVVGDPWQAAAQGDALRAQQMDAATLAAFRQAISSVVAMPSDGALQSRANRLGLNVLNVMWEDTGRSAGSSVGPNISDVTLQVREPVGGGTRTHLLPVIRFPNFSDKTADVPADKLWIKVGNQHKGAQVVTVPLTEVLANLREYLSDPDSVLGDGNLLAKRDTHFLTSAQHVFVPIPKQGKAEFNPVIFNYQSQPQNPAVLTLLCTRQGTSVAVIENSGGDQSFQGWGQQLFHNNQGQKTTFTAERKSDVKARIEAGKATAQDAGALEEGADMLLIVQVPLKYKEPDYRGYGYGSGGGGMMADEAMAMPAAAEPPADSEAKAARRSARSDVEAAVIGHGEDLGPVVEGNKLKLERDDRFPVRVTVQFYKATSNGVVSDADLEDAKKQIDKVYARGDYVGSLVVPEGSRHRPTDWYLGKTPHSAAVRTGERVPPEGPTATEGGSAEEQGFWPRLKSWLFDSPKK
ncbi:MAG: hypothetical protein IT383_01735 [Deltaproteobacteria bacterium]|nr:hypothetical protein [Deltaproteobacteria bacterium]